MAIITPSNLVTTSENPLHKYTTYSYHHVLLACIDNTVAEAEFSKIPFDQLLPNTNAIGNTIARATPRYINNDINQPYVILINTMVDAEFLLKSVTVDIIPAPPPALPVGMSEDYQYARSAFNFGGKMVIEEPFGIRFGDLLALVSKNLGAEPERIVFVLKTAFFGFTDDGASTIQQIRPITMAFNDLQATFTAAGGHYEISFVPYANGLANRQEIADVGGIIKFQMTDSKLSTAMQKVADVLNAEQTRINQDNPDLIPIKYNIVLHDPFPQYTIKDLKNPNKNKTEIQFNGSINDSLTQILEKIMLLSPEVQEDWARVSQTPPDTQTNPKVDRSVFKIHSQVQSTLNTLEVTYHIYPHKVAILPIPTEEDKKDDPTIQKAKRRQALEKIESDAREFNNLLEYNYIYTGKNIDILEFEMKLDLFTTYRLYYIEESNIEAKSQMKNVTGAGTNVSGKKAQINMDKPNKSKKGQWLAKPARRPPSNINDAQEFHKFNEYLSRAASFTGLSCYLTIAGDPRLYSGYLQGPINPQTGQLVTPTDIAQKADNVMANWSLLPALVKVNVVMPNPPTATVQDQTQQEVFGAPFWYDGAFLILSISNMFSEDGKFTQKLELYQVPCDYNIPDITAFDDTKGAVSNQVTSDQAVDANIPPDKQKILAGSITAAQLSDKQKNCLALAYTVAIENNMPPETLQAIILVDSNACTLVDSVVNPQSDVVKGATRLTVTRVQNYLKHDPSILGPISKRSGVALKADSTESIRLLLTRNEEFNMQMCAKIWIEDRNLIKSIMANDFSAVNDLGQVIPSGTTATADVKDITAQATIAHSNIVTKFSQNSFQDVGFAKPENAPVPSRDSYIKLINAQKNLIIDYNQTVLPKILSKGDTRLTH